MTIIDLINKLGRLVSEGKAEHNQHHVRFKQGEDQWELELYYCSTGLDHITVRNLSDRERYVELQKQYKDLGGVGNYKPTPEITAVAEEMHAYKKRYSFPGEYCGHTYEERNMSYDMKDAINQLNEQLKRGHMRRWFNQIAKDWTDITG